MTNGILVVNKPKGMTSHDVVSIVRRKLKIQKVGHAGTLDPMATGVLVLLVGNCTRLFDAFLKFDKEYVATLTFGQKTDSADAFGKLLQTQDFGHIKPQMVEEAFSQYCGEILQVPPMYSAVKHKGRRLYKLALKGQQVVRQPRKVVIKELKALRFELPNVDFYLKCSRGTYVRQLAEDVAARLQCVGHISALERKSVGPYSISSSLSLEQITEDKIQPFKA